MARPAILPALWLWLAACAMGCPLVDGDRILARDLAIADSTFAALDPALDIGPAPLPGVRRVFRAEELLRLAVTHGIAAQGTTSGPLPHEVCFERATEPLSGEALLPALQRALAMDRARIEILDYSRSGVPKGELVFTRAGLSATGLWRGHVTFAQSRSLPIWVRVRVTADQTWLEAAEPLRPGQLIGPEQLAVHTGPRFPLGTAPLDTLDLAIGKKTIRTIRPGEPIYASMLATPREVERGDKVAVEVASGGAMLAFEAKAESPGRTGDTIVVQNPGNGRRFQAKVEGIGRVSVTK